MPEDIRSADRAAGVGFEGCDPKILWRVRFCQSGLLAFRTIAFMVANRTRLYILKPCAMVRVKAEL